MKIQLRYNDHIQLPVAAAFIRGEDVAFWLKEISRWNLLPAEMECYILPVSIQSVQPAGMLVVFTDPAKMKLPDVLEPWCCIAGKLYIPARTELIPQVTEKELKQLLVWDLQILHPVIGFVGFEKKDQVNLAGLFIYDEGIAADWSFAHPGLPVRPPFQQIQVVQPTAEDLLKDIQNEIGQKSLNEIPAGKEDRNSMLDKILDPIKFGLLGGLISVAKMFEKILPVNNAGQRNSTEGEGLFQKLKNWLENNMEELEKRRSSEIERLLKLFDENNNEALQYALPLNSPYLNRGSGTPSSVLTRRSLNFNLGMLGGGRAVDGWDIGDHYHTLRNKYLKAAQKEIEQKDFKKAAYIYAHLLGDYDSAANVLEQGGMYREAAALYKDHLKNVSSAAECFERGGLYIEAIELYTTLERDEKSGDLYRKIKQEKNAVYHYEKHIATKYTNSDYLDAARVIREKLHQPDRAKTTLLEGWNGTYQAEPCLKDYFDMSLENENDDAEKEIKTIFDKHTPRHKKLAFLNVLEYVNKKKNDEAFTSTAREIAYEIAYSETEEGNISVLNNLKRFLPDDKLIQSDTSRYIANLRGKTVQPGNNIPQVINLDPEIVWLKAVWHRNQFLVIGVKKHLLQMARVNWYGNTEYYSWTNIIQSYTHCTFISAPYHSNHILLHLSEGIPITRKNLPRNKYFNEALVVNCPIWLHKAPAQSVINDEGNICRLNVENASMTLHQYSIDGDLKKSIPCVFENGKSWPGNLPSNPGIVCHDKYYYTYKDKQLFTISEQGLTRVFELDTVTRFFSASGSFADFYIVVSTNAGCILYKPSGGNMQMQGAFFAKALIPIAITFLATDRFVINEKTKAVLFEIPAGGTPVQQKEFGCNNNIIAVLPTSSRHQFAMVEETGKIAMYTMED